MSRILYTFMVALLLTTAAVFVLYSQALPAKALPVFVPYGGFVIAGPLAAQSIICPEYSLVNNVDLENGLGPVIGIAIPVTPPAPTYDFNDIFTPGNPLVGGVLPTPCAVGLGGVQVYPIFFDAPDGPFYLTGTGGIPGTY
ncbi:MAG: hypothetical protein P4L74_00470 [Candidatus Doudnabacteria bacterium]|nr:hypothetical protein [Candidatus Doudnabacteria bacterium]